MTKNPGHVSDVDAGFVLQTLEHDQLVGVKRAAIPRRTLSSGELLIVWALRVYLVFMMAVVFWQAWTAR